MLASKADELRKVFLSQLWIRRISFAFWPHVAVLGFSTYCPFESRRLMKVHREICCSKEVHHMMFDKVINGSAEEKEKAR